MDFDRINPHDRYAIDVKADLEAISPNLSSDLNQVLNLSDAQSEQVLRKLLERGCCAQNARNVILGGEVILQLPREWVLERIHRVAKRVLNLTGDDWEFRRLLEVYEKLDRGLLQTLVAAGLKSDNEGIREAAEDFSTES
jgi:hypothetical protein